MPQLNPLALQRYRARKAELAARVAAGEITREAAADQLGAFTRALLERVRERAKPPD